MDLSRQDRNFWERHARHLDRALHLLERPYSRMLALVAEGIEGSGSVLEVAAGTGRISAILAPRVHRLVVTDYAAAMLARARQRLAGGTQQVSGTVHWVQADLCALPFPAGAFPRIVAGNVLHVTPDPAAALASLRRVLAPGGRLIAPTFCHGETVVSRTLSRCLTWSGQPVHRRFTTDSLCREFERNGWRVVRRETLPGWIPIGHVEVVVRH